MKTGLISAGILLALLLTSCNLPGSAPAVHPITSIQGTWTGTLTDSNGGNSYDVELVLSQPGGNSDITGQLTLTDQADASYQEIYSVSGTFLGNTFQFQQGEERFFWGTADSSGMQGQVGWCYECAAWGEFSLSFSSASTNASSYSIRLVDLADGSAVNPVMGENGLPVATTTIEVTGPVPANSVIAIEADNLWVAQVLTDGTDPFTTSMQWTPWHGNGEYTLTVQALNPDAGGVLVSQATQVTVSGIPDGTPTVPERIIQVYQEQFGLTLTAPAFARYTKPGDFAVEESRWVSIAYIGNKMYEVSIFDNGFAGGMAYKIETGDNGFCRPAGEYSMLAIFVDYGNTGLDPSAGAAPMEAWRQHANQVWAEYSASIGLDQPILQISSLETAIVSAPPVPGQTLTIDQVRNLTGKNPSDFDWLVEIDLDANNTVAGQYGGLGISLNGGCLPGGAQRVNIAYSVLSESDLLDGAPGSVFAHELEHGMGWQHWWPNGLADNAGLLTRNFWMPTLLFGWTDTDGDGTIEIYDTSTPYGLVP